MAEKRWTIVLKSNGKPCTTFKFATRAEAEAACEDHERPARLTEVAPTKRRKAGG